MLTVLIYDCCRVELYGSGPGLLEKLYRGAEHEQQSIHTGVDFASYNIKRGMLRLGQKRY